MKIYKCKKCENDRFKKWFKGKVFTGTRKAVRQHLRDEHFITGIKTQHGMDHIESALSENTTSEEIIL